MNKMLYMLLLLVLSFGRQEAVGQEPETVYHLRFRDIDGAVVNMNQYRGKKILVMTMSAGGTADTALASQLNAFYKKYGDSVAVIGVFSIEDGYKSTEKSRLKSKYLDRSKGNLLLTEGMHTRKSKDSTQGILVRWLTSKEHNTHFDQEVKGAGHKFFIDEDGDLYGVFGPEIPLTHKIIDQVISRPRRTTPLPAMKPVKPVTPGS